MVMILAPFLLAALFGSACVSADPPGGLREPVINDFSAKFEEAVNVNPDVKVIFDVANVPAPEAAKAFRNIVAKLFKQGGDTDEVANKIAEFKEKVVLATFGKISPRGLLYACANTMGDIVLRGGQLKSDNTDDMAQKLAKGIADAVKQVGTKSAEDKIEACFDGLGTFLTEFGINLKDLDYQLSADYAKELAIATYFP